MPIKQAFNQVFLFPVFCLFSPALCILFHHVWLSLAAPVYLCMQRAHFVCWLNVFFFAGFLFLFFVGASLSLQLWPLWVIDFFGLPSSFATRFLIFKRWSRSLACWPYLSLLRKHNSEMTQKCLNLNKWAF